MTGVRGHTLPTGTPTATSAFSTTTNRIAAGTYDGAGNLLSLAGVGTMGYDGENRLTSYDNNVASLQEQETYAYDGLGQRVKRTTAIGGTSETTVYAYDAFGQLAAEYSSVAPVEGAGGTFYRMEDHFGRDRPRHPPIRRLTGPQLHSGRAAETPTAVLHARPDDHPL